jgi:hypothetical protein
MRNARSGSRSLLAAVAVALLVSSCGGGGGAGAKTQRSASGPATSTSRPAASPVKPPFQAVIPSGWRSGRTAASSRGYAALYAAIGPRAAGITADMIVTRSRARALSVEAMPTIALSGLQRDKPANRQISRPRRMTIDGAPAVAVRYRHLATPEQLVFHETVDILHGGWLYIVTCTAAHGRTITGPLATMLSSWRWS